MGGFKEIVTLMGRGKWFKPNHSGSHGNERIPLLHPPRVTCKTLPSSGVYHFFDPTSAPKLETNHLLAQGIPLELAKVIAKINSHNRSLSMIGILPNQLRHLLKQVNQKDDGFEEY